MQIRMSYSLKSSDDFLKNEKFTKNFLIQKNFLDN